MVKLESKTTPPKKSLWTLTGYNQLNTNDNKGTFKGPRDKKA